MFLAIREIEPTGIDWVVIKAIPENYYLINVIRSIRLTAILLPQTGAADADATAKRIQDEVEKVEFGTAARIDVYVQLYILLLAGIAILEFTHINAL